MRKMLLAVALLFVAGSMKADENLIVSTLLDHVMPVTQFKSGETKIALLDSVVQIGKANGKSVLDLQAGFNAETKPEAGEVTGANFLATAFFKVSSIVGGKIKFPEHWEFMRSLEHGPAFSYDFREKKSFICYQVGLSFSLHPN